MPDWTGTTGAKEGKEHHRQAGRPVGNARAQQQTRNTECLFAVQFVNGGVAGSVIYGPYDFNPGSRRVHNALSCRSYPPQAAPLLLSAFLLCPFSFLCFFFSFLPILCPCLVLTYMLFIYKAMADHFSIFWMIHIPLLLHPHGPPLYHSDHI